MLIITELLWLKIIMPIITTVCNKLVQNYQRIELKFVDYEDTEKDLSTLLVYSVKRLCFMISVLFLVTRNFLDVRFLLQCPSAVFIMICTTVSIKKSQKIEDRNNKHEESRQENSFSKSTHYEKTGYENTGYENSKDNLLSLFKKDPMNIYSFFLYK